MISSKINAKASHQGQQVKWQQLDTTNDPQILLTQLLHARLRLIVNSHSWTAAHTTVHPPDLTPMMYSRNEDALE